MAENNSIKSFIVPFSEVFAKLITFINTILIMTILSKNDYADYAYIVSIIVWASVVMDGGISNLIFNESLRGEQEKINLYFSTRFVFSGLIISLIVFFFVGYKPSLTFSSIIYSMIILISSSSNIIKMISRGIGARKVDMAIILTEPLMRLILVAGIYFIIPSFQWTLWRFLLIYLMAAVFTFVFSYNYIKPYFKVKIRINKLKEIKHDLAIAFNASKYYLFYYFVYVGISRMDIIMIEANLEKSQLADFSSAFQMYTVVLLFFATINTSQFKKIIKHQAVYIKYLIMVLISVAVLFYFSSGFIIRLLLPENFYPASFVLKKIMFALTPAVLSLFFIYKNNYYHRSNINFFILLIPFFTKLFLYLFLQPRELSIYTHIFLFNEYFLLLLFIMYELYSAKKSNKQAFEKH